MGRANKNWICKNFNTIELEADGIKNYAAIIVQKSNPKLTEIIKDFDDVIKILNDKPQ